MTTLVYPSNAVLNQVAQVLVPQITQADLFFQVMPMKDLDSDILIWDQMDDFIGLQQIRGINGAPPKVQPTGAKQWMTQPGYYGEQLPIDEAQLTRRRQYGTFNVPINIDDLVREKQKQLLQRRLTRIKYIGWTLLTTGTFSVSHPNGAVVHTDTFNLLTQAGSAWTNPATGTPLADLRTIQQQGPQYGTEFNGNSMAIMNRVTANYMLSNTNAADIGGKRTSGLANILSMGDVNALLTGEDLPNIVIYDKGYKNDAGTFTRYIPNLKIAIIGRRDAGDPIANFLFTRNANNPGMAPGPYMKIRDSADYNEVPREVVVHDGWNGGPAIYFPGSIIILTVT